MKSSIKLATVWAVALTVIGLAFACGVTPTPGEGIAFLGL